MNKTIRPFEVKKTFGIDVLLKLMKTDNNDLKIFEKAGSYRFDISMKELINKADFTLKYHNIYLRV